MYILALDCSTALGSVAISKGSNILSSLLWKHQKSHAKHLVTCLSSALDMASLSSFNQLDLIAVGNGPGSFTGLRVALSVAKTLAYCLDLPIVVFNSLRLLSEGHQIQVDRKGTVYTLQNAFAQKFFFAQYLRTSKECIEVEPPQVIHRDQISSYLKEHGVVLGCVDVLPQEILSAQHLNLSKDSLKNYPQAQNLAILSAKCDSQQYLTWEHVLPLYLKASAAEEKMNMNF